MYSLESLGDYIQDILRQAPELLKAVINYGWEGPAGEIDLVPIDLSFFVVYLEDKCVNTVRNDTTVHGRQLWKLPRQIIKWRSKGVLIKLTTTHSK